MKKINNKALKACLFTTVHIPFDTRIFRKEAKSLAKVGYHVTLIAQHDKDETVDGITILRIAKPKNRLERMTRTAWLVYRIALENDADIYHFHDPELILVGLFLKLKGKRVIYDVHEDVPRDLLVKNYIPAGFRKPMSTIVEIIERMFARYFDGVITATPFINTRFLRLGANSENINNYPLLSELYVPDNRWERKEKVVCYIGGIAGFRSAAEIVEAIGKTKYCLVIAGDMENGIEKKLRQMKGWRQVKSLGYIKRDLVKTIMADSMAGLVLFYPEPNHVDSQPNKMFEYMSSGIPVIASNFPLWREIIEGAGCGICVDPLDPNEIAQAISWIIEHPVEAEQMGKNGRRAVEGCYNWDFEERKLIRFYAKILNMKSLCIGK